MDLFIQQIFNGVMLGSTYALVALGLTLVYGILQIPNFAHGNMYMLGAYVCLTLITVFGLTYWPALAATAIIMAGGGVILEKLCYRPLRVRHASPVTPFIAALGALMVLENGVQAIWGPMGKRFANPYPRIIDLFGITTSHQRLLVIVVAVVLLIALQIFIKKSTLGSTIEAMAQDQEGAMLVGINVDRVSSMTFAISTALAAVAACLVAPIFMVSPSMGVLLGMKAFVICILGGLGSVPGAIFGSMILGVIEALGAGYVSAEYKDAFAFGALVLILAFKPTGLFGKEVQER
jgi:branched-chain amino acid transport system permease protein